ncbi:unnamed protein product [Brachionus calyciflorus]|uniref:Uncharacterized protein n=1 Tax=Brachionus calyciflorus TaxID=104777 RepID=A0A814R851_9BILA|nr:unnamed protein product [Brachionus calyciflorus]
MSSDRSLRKHFSIDSIESDDNIQVDQNYDTLFTSQNSLSNRNRNDLDAYTLNYRIIKTTLLIFAWISFGLNLEIIGPTFEDLKIYLQVNYSSISFALVLRNIGYLILTILFGLVLDKYSKYSETLMSIASAVIAISNFLMPITRNYLIQIFYFLFQGLAQAIYDLGGNYIILNLWSSVNTSPINAMHAGYGMGAILATQMAKQFIKFDPYHTNSTLTISNTTSLILKSSDINLKTPYWIASLIALIISVLFYLSQIIETKNRLKYEHNRKQLILLSEEFNLDDASIGTSSSLIETKMSNVIKKMFLGKDKLNNLTQNQLNLILIQIVLFIIVFVFNQGYFTILSRFMITYLTIGPARLDVEIFIIIQTLFWAFFIVGRFLAAYLAFKFDTIKFFMWVLIGNFMVTILFLIPFLTEFKIFFWIGVSLLGLCSGPITPTGIMLAKQLLDINSFVLSLFIVGLAGGGIIFQQLTGALLDFYEPNKTSWMGFSQANSAFILPHLASIASFLCLSFFVPIYLIHRKIFNFYRK